MMGVAEAMNLGMQLGIDKKVLAGIINTRYPGFQRKKIAALFYFYTLAETLSAKSERWLVGSCVLGFVCFFRVVFGSLSVLGAFVVGLCDVGKPGCLSLTVFFLHQLWSLLVQ